MALHNELGKEGEAFALNYLERNNYQILEKNWRKSHLEIDIIGKKGNTLVIFEVKTRTYAHAEPADALSRKKEKFLINAADFYIQGLDWDPDVRFDLLFIGKNDGQFNLQHIEDAFNPSF